MSFRISFVVSVLLFVVFASRGLGQLTQNEIYQLDVFAMKKSGDSPEKVAGYFIQMGLQVQERLRFEQKRGQLDEQSAHTLKLLDEALKPINDFWANLYSSDIAEGERATDKEARELLFSAETANRAFVAIGEEEAVRLTAARVLENLKLSTENVRESSYSPVNLVVNDVIKELMDFSDQQIQDIEKITETAKDKMRVGSRPEFEQLERLLRSHWELLLFELDTEQKAMAEDLLGEPVQWFRNAGSQELKTINFASGVFVTTSHSSSKKLSKALEGRSINEMTREELESRDINIFSTVSLKMLESPFVWDELELTPDQRKEVKNATKNCDYSSSSLDDAHLNYLLNREASLPKSVTSALTKSQCSWFHQMELQIYTAKYASSIGFLHPRMTDTLKLNRSQIDRIRVLAKEFEREAESLGLIIKNEREQIQKDFESEVREVLTDKQNSIFNKFTKAGNQVRSGQ